VPLLPQCLHTTGKVVASTLRLYAKISAPTAHLLLIGVSEPADEPAIVCGVCWLSFGGEPKLLMATKRRNNSTSSIQPPRAAGSFFSPGMDSNRKVLKTKQFNSSHIALETKRQYYQ
jgi:hypothetical protein